MKSPTKNNLLGIEVGDKLVLKLGPAYIYGLYAHRDVEGEAFSLPLHNGDIVIVDRVQKARKRGLQVRVTARLRHYRDYKFRVDGDTFSENLGP